MKKSTSASKEAATSPSHLIDARIAALEDPSGLFNSSLDGNIRRALDIREGDKIDEKAFKALIRAAVALNTAKRAIAGPVRAAKKPKSA